MDDFHVEIFRDDIFSIVDPSFHDFVHFLGGQGSGVLYIEVSKLLFSNGYRFSYYLFLLLYFFIQDF